MRVYLAVVGCGWFMAVHLLAQNPTPTYVILFNQTPDLMNSESAALILDRNCLVCFRKAMTTGSNTEISRVQV
jgi:hypothetical protein